MSTTPTLSELATWLHAAYDRPPQTPECKDMLARVDAALTQGAGAVEPVAWMDPDSRETVNAERKADWETINGYGGKKKASLFTAPLYLAPPAQQLQQAVARAVEECAAICEGIEDRYQETEGHKYPELKSDAQTGASDCAAAIRAKGTHD